MGAREYPKIETLFNRDKDTFRVTDELRDPTFGQLKTWLVTEKIDGTNIRVSLEVDPAWMSNGDDSLAPYVVRFYARTDAGQIPPFLLEYLEATFTLDRLRAVWRGTPDCDKCSGTGTIPGSLGGFACECVVPYPVVLYGEGYGERIQKGGGNYRQGVSFRLFDVLVADRSWLDWKNVVDVADRLGISWVPCLGTQTLEQIVKMVKEGGPQSTVAYEENRGKEIMAEGVVARSELYLYDRRGRPLRFKLKNIDYRGKGD